MNLLFMANNGLPKNGLVALYDMGKQIALGNTGQTLVDFSGKGNSAQLGSTAGADTNDPAYSGQGLVFGADDYVTTVSSFSTAPTAFTVIFVLKDLETTTEHRYISAFGNGITIGMNNGGGGVNAYVNSANTYVDAYFATNIPLMLGYSHDGQTAKIYKGGALARTALTGPPESQAPLSIELGRGANGTYMGGVIYSFAYYNRALSDTEYMQAYNYLKRLMSSRGITI